MNIDSTEPKLKVLDYNIYPSLEVKLNRALITALQWLLVVSSETAIFQVLIITRKRHSSLLIYHYKIAQLRSHWNVPLRERVDVPLQESVGVPLQESVDVSLQEAVVIRFLYQFCKTVRLLFLNNVYIFCRQLLPTLKLSFFTLKQHPPTDTTDLSFIHPSSSADDDNYMIIENSELNISHIS